MRFDLTTPCTNCPFRSDETRITFRNRERAAEIEEHAYRNGFPCHVSANVNEDPVHGEETFVFGENTQHCAGFILMQPHEHSGSPWPGINNDEKLLERLEERMDWDAPVFHNADEFMDANNNCEEQMSETAGDEEPESAR